MSVIYTRIYVYIYICIYICMFELVLIIFHHMHIL